MTEIWQLFGGLFIALIFASSVGYILKRRSGVDTPNSVIDNLNARINAWWVMIGIIFIASLLGFYGVIGLFLIISFMGLREFLSLLNIRRGDHLALAACFYRSEERRVGKECRSGWRPGAYREKWMR